MDWTYKAAMEDTLKRMRSDPPLIVTDSLSLSSKEVPSNQVTRLDKGLPVIVPLDTLDQVQCYII